jgi:hypothetical protein
MQSHAALQILSFLLVISLRPGYFLVYYSCKIMKCRLALLHFSITFTLALQVGIATRYGLEGQRIEYTTRPDRPRVPPRLLYNGYWVSPEDKGSEAWHWQRTSPRAEVKESVELYLYSPSVPKWPVLRWIGIAYWTQNLLLVLMQVWFSPIFIKCINMRSGFVSVRAALRSHFIFFQQCLSK